MKKEKIKTLLEQYNEKKELLNKFLTTVCNVLDYLLKFNNFKNQPIQKRIKELSSLENKLKKNEKLKNINSIYEVWDVCECRILFYLERDINVFKRFIYKEFDVVNEELKYSPSGYNAHHVTVKLNKDRLAISEYSIFEDLLCEIQLTTVLYHAWSEMEHDIIYKDQEQLSNFDEESFRSIQKIFQNIMENYLKKANYDFEFAYNQFEKLKMGKRIFSPEFFKEITASDSLNTIYENLSLVYQYIQEYGDKTPDEFNIINIVKQIISNGKDLKCENINSIYGEITGYSYIKIVILCLEILEILRYQYPEEIIEILMGLSTSETEEISKKALDVINKMAQYNLSVIEKVGYSSQFFLLNKIENFDDEDLNKFFNPISTIIKEILNPEFEGQTITGESLVIKFGPLQITGKLKKLRRKAINMLEKLYEIIENLTFKITVIETFDSATQLPQRGEVSDIMLKMVLQDTNYIVDFYLSIMFKADNEIIRNIDEHILWINRRFKKDKIKNLLKIQKNINSNTEYNIYKVLVGFVRGLSGNYKNEEDYRENKIQDYVNEISPNNFDEWEKKILNIAEKNKIVKPGELCFFNKFLFILGKQKPKIALELVNDKKLEDFYIFIIRGIWQSKLKGRAKDLILDWIANEEHLDVGVGVFFNIPEIDLEILEKIFLVAKRKKNLDILTEIINVIIVSKNIKAKELFLKVIKELTINNSSDWTNRYFGKAEILLDNISIDEYDIILENLLFTNNISYSEETILLPLAKKSLNKVVNFFYNRIILSLERKKLTDKYNPIPHHLDNLLLFLQKKETLNIILKWFNKKYRLIHLHSSQLINTIFPEFEDILKNELLELLNKDFKKNIDTVFNILEFYEGKDCIFDFSKIMIGKYSFNEKRGKVLFRILTRTGVVSGEYGFVRAYEEKKERIQLWKEDRNKNIKKFFMQYEEYLDKNILYQTKEADEEIAYRKLAFEKKD